MNPKSFLVLLSVFVFTNLLSPFWQGPFLALAQEPSATASSSRPNFLVIVSDDQRNRTLGKYMPYTQRRIFEEGAQFNKAYITTPLCCPSRATIMTGLYASRNHVTHNSSVLRKETIFNVLGRAGYATALVGKYLNTWSGAKREEIDYWASFRGGSSTYNNPALNVQGRWKKHHGYMTDILSRYAIEFLQQMATGGKPFVMFFTPNSPHRPFVPAARDDGAWKHEQDLLLPSYNLIDESAKPPWYVRKKPLRASVIIHNAQKQLEMLLSLDRAIERIIEELKALKLLDNTVIFYISDNGVSWGEFGLRDKGVAYEPIAQVPFAIRHPTLGRKSIDTVVANIDIAPTIYKLAGVEAPYELDGVSLMPLVRGETVNRDGVLIEGFVTQRDRRPHLALFTQRHSLIYNMGWQKELYDLQADPHQLKNIAGDSNYSDLLSQLGDKTEAQLKTLGSSLQRRGFDK